MRRTKKLPVEELAPFMLSDVPRGTPAPPIVWRDLFGNDNPVEIEVGFGKGLFLTTAGAAQPGTNFLGIEIMRKYQYYAATRLLLRQLTNVRVACADGRAVLRDQVAPQSVDAVHVYFPDPWWKARHRKRRVFTPEFAHIAGRVLHSGGRLLIATDVEAYFGIMTQIVRDLGSAYRELPPPAATEPRHDMDYLTNFERKFRKEGRPIYRAAYERTSDRLPMTLAADPGLEGPFTEFRPNETPAP
ncbi:MAG TPA: tRNA (guanosine(46)-N7)-methyltransferase TrmB [Gemmataceae bacterium]|nr:tRNA (guanosine(46)-N7)-methyltransferase TrmB [Gemmataceae bacterium]